jgi:hypothetical protein
MDKKIIGIFFITLFIFFMSIGSIIMYFNKKIENITLESLCKKDGNCFYNSKNGTLSVNNIDATNGFISNLTIPSGKIHLVNGEVICKSIKC